MKYDSPDNSNLKILEFDSALYSEGFIYSYALTNKWEDFASFAENIFIYQPAFWNAIRDNKRLWNKFEIICSYYQALDPMLNRQYFLDLNKITLSNISYK